NICRSPMVEYAVREALEQAGLGDRVEVASAGTSGWEVGNPIDPRAGALLSRHGLSTDAHRARQMDDAELQAADLVLTLDHDHVAPVRRALGPDRAEQTVRMVRDFAPHAVEDTGIRDPWYGDESGFESAWEQIDEALPGIVDHVRAAVEESAGGRRSAFGTCSSEAPATPPRRCAAGRSTSSSSPSARSSRRGPPGRRWEHSLICSRTSPVSRPAPRPRSWRSPAAPAPSRRSP